MSSVALKFLVKFNCGSKMNPKKTTQSTSTQSTRQFQQFPLKIVWTTKIIAKYAPPPQFPSNSTSKIPFPKPTTLTVHIGLFLHRAEIYIV